MMKINLKTRPLFKISVELCFIIVLILSSGFVAKADAVEHRVFLNDHLGNVTTITDENGRVLQRNVITPYGEISRMTDGEGQEITMQQSLSKRLFTGHYYDEESNLHYMNARYYDVASKRFASLDPSYYGNSPGKAFSNIEGSTMATNAIGYVEGRATRYVDISGLVAELPGNHRCLGGNCFSAQLTKDNIKAVAELEGKDKIVAVVRIRRCPDGIQCLKNLKNKMLGRKTFDEDSLVAAAGMKPITIKAFGYNHKKLYNALYTVMKRYPDGGALFHCKNGRDRTGVAEVLWRAVFLDEPFEEAYEKGMKQHLEHAGKSWINGIVYGPIGSKKHIERWVSNYKKGRERDKKIADNLNKSGLGKKGWTFYHAK